MNEPAPARLSGVSKAYGTTSALNCIEFEVRRGETLALLGPNGAGKTTALRVLLGIVAADSGSALLFGADPRRYQTRRRVGVMLQAGGVPATLTVGELVSLFSTYYPQPLPRGEALEHAGAAALAKRRFSELSGGQQQRMTSPKRSDSGTASRSYVTAASSTSEPRTNSSHVVRPARLKTPCSRSPASRRNR